MKFKVGDEVRWARYIDFKKELIPIQKLNPQIKKMIKNRTPLKIKSVEKNNKYKVTTKGVTISQYFFEGELEFLKITNWTERIK